MCNVCVFALLTNCMLPPPPPPPPQAGTCELVTAFKTLLFADLYSRDPCITFLLHS